MTTPAQRDPSPLSDPRVDAAWRVSSHENPPAPVDAAILAAARREAGAAPQRIAAREALAARRRWWPLAAAATVTAIAVGVLQLTTPDELGAPASEKTVVTDMPTQAAAPASKKAVPTDLPTPGARAPETLPRAEETKSRSGGDLEAGRVTARADATQNPAPSITAHPPQKLESAKGNAVALPEPFPGATPPPVATGVPAPGPARQSAVVPPSSPAPQRDAASGFPMSGGAAEPVAAPAPASGIAAPTPAAPPASVSSARPAGAIISARPAPLAKSTAERADAGMDEARARANLTIADWIALIRRLRDEGRTADVIKELAAFRAAHVDHDKLLPPDLRQWRPPGK